MRVQWLSSAALLAIIAAPGAFAQSVSTNEPFKITISGSSQAAVQVVQASDAATKANELNSIGMASKTRLNITADATTNDINYGVNVGIDVADKAFDGSGANNLFIAPAGLGKLTLGQASYNTDYAGADSSMLWGTASFVSFGPNWGWGAQATGDGGRMSAAADLIDGSGLDDNGNKISYTTPDLMGFGATVAFQPDASKKNWTFNRKTDTGSGYNNVIGVGASYTTPDMSGVTATAAGAFVMGTANTLGKSVVNEDLMAYQARLGVTAYGVMAQFAFNAPGTSGQSKVAGAPKSVSVTGMLGSLAYATGPFQVGAYFAMNNDKADGEHLGIGGGAHYNISKGVQAFAGYETFTDTPKVGTEQTAGAATVGLAVVF